jgi:hypothetical protein
MTLPKEWQELAQREAQETTDIEKFSNQGDYNKALNAAEYDYLQGATAYKQAVEKMLKRHKSETDHDAKAEQDANTYQRLIGISRGLEFALTELQTLKPTSND